MRIKQWLYPIVCLLIATILLLPVIWLLLGSVLPAYTPLVDLVAAPFSLQLTVENYVTATTVVPMGRFALNSLLVVLVALPLTLLVASWAGFAMTQLPASAQRFMLWSSLAALMVPPTALWLARFPLFKALGWINTPLALIAPALLGGSPFFVLIFYWSFRRLPADLFHAARLDGASPWRLWGWIALPAAPTAFWGVTLLSSLFFWSNFTDPLLYIRAQAQMTLPVGVRLLAQLDPTQWPLLLAGSALLTLPVILLPAILFPIIRQTLVVVGYEE